MKSVLKWIGIVLGGLVGLVVLAAAAVYLVSEIRINRAYDIPADEVSIPTDSESIARGEHLATSVTDCGGCHGEDLSGGVMIEDPAVGVLTASNLTSGEGGIGGTYTDEDWLRAMRHGVGPDGKPLLFMPSHEFNHLSGEDVGDVIAYVKSVPPVDNTPGESSIALPIRALFLLGQVALLPVEQIDHDAPPPEAVQAGPTVEYGEYLATGCTGCHGASFSGGPIPGAPPDLPPASNLTPDEETGLGTWTEEDFFRVMREGVRPDGTEIDPFMPWESLGRMSDEELTSLFLYLQSLPAREFGNR